MQVPCKGCADRKLGCHSTCDKYIQFKKYLAEINRARNDYNHAHNDWWNVRRKRGADR